jgi:5-formyltetrahydrofolate cyclo-ligase
MKSTLRRQMKSLLAAISPKERRQRSRAATDRLTDLPEFHDSGTLMTFLSLPHEVDSAPVILRAWQLGKTVVVPKTVVGRRRLIPYQIETLDTGLTAGPYGIPEPMDGTPYPLTMINMVIVPGLAFDTRGNRLGKGAGFYDRFLRENGFTGIKAGLCFHEQVVEEIPSEPHDVPLDLLVTDQGVYRFRTGKVDAAVVGGGPED